VWFNENECVNGAVYKALCARHINERNWNEKDKLARFFKRVIKEKHGEAKFL